MEIDLAKVFTITEYKDEPEVIVDLKNYNEDGDLVNQLHSADDAYGADDILAWCYRNQGKWGIRGREIHLLPRVVEEIVRYIGMVAYHNTIGDKLPMKYSNTITELRVFGFKIKTYGRDGNPYYSKLSSALEEVRKFALMNKRLKGQPNYVEVEHRSEEH